MRQGHHAVGGRGRREELLAEYSNTPTRKLRIRRNKLAQQLQQIDDVLADRIKNPYVKKMSTQLFGNWTLYVLRCEDDCYYIGITTNLDKRFSKHQSGSGAWFTKLHKPIKIIHTEVLGKMYDYEAVVFESQLAAQYLVDYGVDKVRGGRFIQKDPKHFVKDIDKYLDYIQPS